MRYVKKRKLWKDDKGILGMPLEILVMVIIAAVAITILVLWLSTGASLDHIDVVAGDYPENVSDITNGFDYTIEVTAYDSNGNTLEGATVRATGPGIESTLSTNHMGLAEFDYTPDLPRNVNTGVVRIEVEYSSSGILGTTNRVSHNIPVNR